MAVTAPNDDSDKNMQVVVENGGNDTANGNGNAQVKEEPSDDEDEVADAAAPAGVAAKKKKKKKSKKKKVVQTDPPRVPLSKFYPTGNYPTGEIVEYKDDNAYRVSSAEKKHIEQLTNEDPEETYANIRKAAEVHRTVRSAVRKYMRPGVKLVDVAEYIEDAVRALVEHDVEKPLEAGIAFPTGVNVNHCAAHWSPRSGETTVINQADVIKVDFGVHVKGRIVDSAFTVNFEPTYDVLLEAVRAATNAGVKAAGIDARLGEIAGEIQETMESYEVEVGGKVYPVKPIENLSGHSIHKYQIHGDKSILLVKNDDQRKMEEGEYFAIETFGSTGRGRTVDGPECSHFGKRPGLTTIPPLRLNSAKSLLKTINKNFGTLAFTQRYLERAGESKYILGLNHLISQGILMDYPPLYDQRGSMTAQFEHTILLRPTCKEIVSRGDDY